MNTSKFVSWYKDARERVVWTAAYLLGAVASVQLVVDNTGMFQAEWQQFTAIGGVTLALNVIKVIAATKVGEKGTASTVLHPEPSLEGDGSDQEPFRGESGSGAVCEAIASDDDERTTN